MLFDEKVSFAKITFNFNMEFFLNAIEFYTVSHILSKTCETAKTQKRAVFRAIFPRFKG